jgi:galactonate dehydratase
VEAGDIDLLTYLKDQSVFNIEDGNVKASTGVGVGIEIDEDVIRKIAKETDPWTCKEFHRPDGYIKEW